MENLVITHKQDYVIIQLNRGKVNAINHPLVNELRTSISKFKDDPEVRGVIITGKPNFFSAGLDVIELYQYDREKIGAFFKDFGNMYIELAKFPKPLIAAITGHSPAGGTVIAITCDYRVMAEGEKYTIGLNEVAVNIQISEDIIRGYAFWLGRGQATKYLLQGKLLKSYEALRVGLLDEVVPEGDVLKSAEAQMQKYLLAHDGIFQSTKYKCRKNWLESLNEDGEAAFEESLTTWWKPEVRSLMKGFVDRLTKK